MAASQCGRVGSDDRLSKMRLCYVSLWGGLEIQGSQGGGKQV